MKQLLLTCFVFAAMTGTISAQVSKKDFMAKADVLVAAIQARDQQSEINTYSQVSAMMLTEISYLTSQGSAGAAKLKIERELHHEIGTLQAGISQSRSNMNETNLKLMYDKLSAFAAQL